MLNVLTKQTAACFLSLTSLIVMCLSVGNTRAQGPSPAKCGCLQTLTATADTAELSFYHSDFSLSATDPETQSNWLRLETLTGGRWVKLDRDQPMINTTSQPLRISYVHTKPKQRTLEVSLVLKQFLTKATLDSDASKTESAGFKLTADATPTSSYLLQNLNSVVIPRLTPGVYSLQLKFNTIKKPQIHWLQVLPTPPEPPQLVSLNRRLAERGKLTLKLKNVVVGDLIHFYVNGEEGPGVNITRESQLEQYVSLGSILPPGKSKITALLKRGDQLSADSSPVSVNSRATVLMSRNIEVRGDEFNELSKEVLKSEREQSETGFGFVKPKPQDPDCNSDKAAEQDAPASALPQASDNQLASISTFQSPPGDKGGSTEKSKKKQTEESQPADAEQNNTTGQQNDTTVQKEKTISIKEFVFPYPASFPVPRYGQRGNKIETEGVVLDQMRLVIARNGQYQLDFHARTTMRAEINLQLLVKLDNNHWYPITLPRQTIIPEKYKSSSSGSVETDEPQWISIKGYAPIFVNRRDMIQDIRRRGTAVLGTRPY